MTLALQRQLLRGLENSKRENRVMAERAVKFEVFYATLNLPPRVLLRGFRLFFCRGPVRQPPTPDVRPKDAHLGVILKR